MRRRLPSERWTGLPRMATALAAAAIVLGALVWFRPYLTRRQAFPSAVPAPVALGPASTFAVASGVQACMYSVAVEPDSRVAGFRASPATASSAGGPPVELILEGRGYRTSSLLPGGYRGGVVSVRVTPPRHSLLATACFVNRGAETVTLAGSTEARTISRSGTTIAGAPVVGDIALRFLDTRPSSLLDSLGTVFGHASNLTDHLVPVWLIWILALLTAFGVPVAILAAFHRALVEDEAPSSG